MLQSSQINLGVDGLAVLRATARRSTRADGAPQRRITPLENAQRTAAAVTLLDGWYWPQWLERQRRPNHAAFVALGELPLVENLTGRSATTVGTIGAGALACVDPAGFVVPQLGQWGIDWSVRGAERWHAAATSPGVRQRLFDEAPIVETALRVGDGDVVQRVYGVTGEREIGDCLVIEFDNESSLPVAISIAIRPCHLLGAGVIDAIELDASGCRVNEQPAVIFFRSPAAYASGSYENGDSVGVVHADAALPDPPRRTTCTFGLANAAAVFPVPHHTSVRIMLAPRAPRRSSPRPPDRLVGPEAAARGWSTHTRRAAAPPFISDGHRSAYSIALRRMMLAVDPTGVLPIPGLGPGTTIDETRLVGALVRAGLGRHAAPVLAAKLDEHRLDGWLRRDEPSVARNLALLDVATSHWICTRDVATALACLPSTAKLLQWCVRRLERHEGSISPADLHAYANALLEIAEESEYPQTADDLRNVLSVIAWHQDREEPDTADSDIPAPPPADGVLVSSPRGIELARSIEGAAGRAAQGDRRAVELVAAFVEQRSPTGSWPTVRHPRTGAGTAGAADDPYVAAAFVDASLALARAETLERDGTCAVRLLPVAADAWRTGEIDVRAVPLRAGRLSFSVRWHGERPALLWELAPRPGGAAPPVRLSCPGLDPAWSTTERAGEALLGPWLAS